MKIGLIFVNAGPFSEPAAFRNLVTSAEANGFESLWSVEHVVFPDGFKSPYPYTANGKLEGPGDAPLPDPLIHLAFAASITTRIKLGTAVMILPQRSPLYVAKEVASLDRLSGGRMLLGIGSGWLAEEFEALQLDWKKRGLMTDEAIQSLRALWRENPSSFHGKYFNFGPVRSLPKPVQAGGVPILVGGHSPAAVRRAARFGDGFFPAVGELKGLSWQVDAAALAKLRELLQSLRVECEKIGRNFVEMEISCIGPTNLDTLKALQDEGVSRVVIGPPSFEPEALKRGLEKISGEIISKF
ncbi:MAG: LLM class F420-dependent oxidoreductase [Candidatus Binataceae bacterium]